jgi:hypothetical protein
MRVVTLSSNNQEPDGLLQDAYTRGPYHDANEGSHEEILAAEITDSLSRKTRPIHQATQVSLKPRRTSLDDIACGHGFVWYPQPFVDFGGELPRTSRLVSHALQEIAKHERRRARRAWSWLLVLAIGACTLAVSGTQDSLKALQFIGIDVAQLLSTAPL